MYICVVVVSCLRVVATSARVLSRRVIIHKWTACCLYTLLAEPVLAVVLFLERIVANHYFCRNLLEKKYIYTPYISTVSIYLSIYLYIYLYIMWYLYNQPNGLLRVPRQWPVARSLAESTEFNVRMFRLSIIFLQEEQTTYMLYIYMCPRLFNPPESESTEHIRYRHTGGPIYLTVGDRLTRNLRHTIHLHGAFVCNTWTCIIYMYLYTYMLQAATVRT